MEAGETSEQALQRELREEIGVTPVQWRKWAALQAPAMGAENVRMLRMHIFLVTQWRGEPRNLLPDEHDEIAWFTLDDATKLTLAHADYSLLFRDALNVAQ